MIPKFIWFLCLKYVMKLNPINPKSCTFFFWNKILSIQRKDKGGKQAVFFISVSLNLFTNSLKVQALFNVWRSTLDKKQRFNKENTKWANKRMCPLSSANIVIHKRAKWTRFGSNMNYFHMEEVKNPNKYQPSIHPFGALSALAW